MKYYKKTIENEIFVKAIDNNNNYSIASNLDPEPDGYTNHAWEEDADDWEEITFE